MSQKHEMLRRVAAVFPSTEEEKLPTGHMIVFMGRQKWGLSYKMMSNGEWIGEGDWDSDGIESGYEDPTLAHYMKAIEKGMKHAYQLGYYIKTTELIFGEQGE